MSIISLRIPPRKYLRFYFPADLKAGFVTSVVALPLAIAFAIASGVPPIMGMYTAVIAGALTAVFGGSRFSITGPTGAMTVIILSTVNRHGLEGLFLAGLIAGVLQASFGLFKLGRFVKFIPLPVVSGFTAGIGIIIFVGQVANALGIQVPSEEFIGNTIADIVKTIGDLNPLALLLSAGTVVSLWFLPPILKRIYPLKDVPPSLIPLIAAVGAAWYFQLPVPQVGDIPQGLPDFHVLNLNYELAREVMPAALTIALLGTIEALLCAVVCDAMTDTRHDSDQELKAQGLANMVLPWFSGIPCTAAIARSAVNIREGARTRAAGGIHALLLLSYMLVLSPLVSLVPMAYLAGVLMFVSARMVNFREIRTIMRISRQDGTVLFITLALTVFTDLVFAVQVGMLLAIFLLFVRLVNAGDVSTIEEYDPTDTIWSLVSDQKKISEKLGIYTIHGPFFFGTMNIFEEKVNEHMHNSRPVILLRLKHVPFIDSTGQTRLVEFIEDRVKRGRIVLIAGLQPPVRRRLESDAIFREHVPPERIFERSAQAIQYAEQLLEKKEAAKV